MNCHNEQGVHIPGCMGCAASGEEGCARCTCVRWPRDRYGNDAHLADKVTALEKRVAELEQLLVGRG